MLHEKLKNCRNQSRNLIKKSIILQQTSVKLSVINKTYAFHKSLLHDTKMLRSRYDDVLSVT